MVTDTDADTKMLMRPVFFYLPSTFIWGDDHKTLGPCIVDWTKTGAWAKKGGSKQSKGGGGRWVGCKFAVRVACEKCQVALSVCCRQWLLQN